jgi:FkbM family methyltransferase
MKEPPPSKSAHVSRKTPVRSRAGGIDRTPTERVFFEDKQIRLFAPNEITRRRAASFWTKEPGTIAWIESFKPGGIFWDVGANVGLYSLYAAVKRDTRVFAFEPSAANYYTLNRNIELNRLSDSIRALCLCLSDRREAGSFFMRSTQLGDALHSFGKPVDFRGEQMAVGFVQGALSTSADDLVREFGLATPNYMKVDVDGLETQVLTGAERILADPNFISLQVEVNMDDHVEREWTREMASRVGLTEQNLAAATTQVYRGVAMKNLVFSRK